MKILGLNISLDKGEKDVVSAEQKDIAIRAAKEKAFSDGSTVITLDDIGKLGSSVETLALRTEAVFACLRDKSESIGQMPLRLYKNETGSDRLQIKTGRNHRIFTQKPNDYMTMSQFLEMGTVGLERRGVFYGYIERNDRGSVMSVIPFRHQDNVHPNMDINGNVHYTYVRNDGTQGDAYNLEDLFIIKGFTFDGFTPVSPMRQTATNLNISNAQEKTQEEGQVNGITSQMALGSDLVFGDDARERVRDDWEQFRGPKGVKKIPILEQGLKPISLKLTPAETELLKNREFTVNRICRTFRVPIHRVGVINVSPKDTINNLDEAYMRDSLNPVLVKVENAFNELLPDGFKVEFNRNAFYMGSPWRLLEHVEKGVKGGLLSINEGREILGWEPVEGGGVHAIDNNNVVYGFWNDLEALKEALYGNSGDGKKPTENGDENEV